MAGQTITMVEGITDNLGFSLTGSDGKPVPNSAFTATVAIGDGTIVVVNIGGMQIVGIKGGTTTVIWTFTPKVGQGYEGAPLTLDPDTIIITPKSLASGIVTYTPSA